MKIIDAIENAGGNPMFVGGCVRDQILGIACKDIDIEVHGLSLDKLEQVLSKHGSVDAVGKSFGVLKFEGMDFSVPRRDNKVGIGHKGFKIEFDNMSYEEALARRDFTINSIGKIHDTFIDPFGGMQDLQDGILRHTSEHFAEDPLRVLRGFQFCSRFELTPAEETVELCKTIKQDELPKERIWEEWKKWALKSQCPSLGIEFLEKTEWLPKQIKNLIGVQQNPVYHPEGDAYIHTLLVVNAMNEICINDEITNERKLVLMLAALCHDFGKCLPENGGCTVYSDAWISPGHAEAGVPLAQEFLNSIGCPLSITEKVLPLVKEHMVLCSGELSARMVRRLSVRLEKASIDDLCYLIHADHAGRPPLPNEEPEECKNLRDFAIGMRIGFEKPKPLVNGDDLKQRGYTEGKKLGDKLKELYELQLDGKNREELLTLI